MLISNGFVKQNDSAISDYPDHYFSKYMFYADALSKASTLFERIQNHLQVSLKDLIALDAYRVQVKDVKTDGDIGATT